MSLGTILAIVVVIIILIIIYKRLTAVETAPIVSRKGYFINQKHLGAVFPQTGESVTLILMKDRFVIAALDDKTNAYIPKVFPDFENRIIIVPELNKQTETANDPNLHLYACKTIDDPLDTKDTFFLQVTSDQDTNLPTTRLAPLSNSDAAIWKFVPTIENPLDRLRKQLGLATKGVFMDMPDKLPQWIFDNPALAAAYKSGSFSGSLKNVKYPELLYPGKVVRMKRWGPVGVVVVREGDIGADPQILLIPTLTELQFRVFSLQSAVPNKETGGLENYTQLIATNGAIFEMTKNYADTDAARWTLMLAK